MAEESVMQLLSGLHVGINHDQSILAPYRHFHSSKSLSSVVVSAKSDLLRASPFWRSGAVCSPSSARSNRVLT